MALDLLIVGRVATLAGDRGFGWVDALGVSGGRVVAAGTRADVEALAGTATRRLDVAPDEVVMPARGCPPGVRRGRPVRERRPVARHRPGRDPERSRLGR